MDKNLAKIVQVNTSETSSDHKLISSILKINGNVGTNTAIRARDCRKFDSEKYLMELCASDSLDIYDIKDPTLKATRITENICLLLDRMAPVKLRNLKTN